MRLTQSGKIPKAKLKAWLAGGRSNYLQSIDPDVMEAYPAWELVHLWDRPTSVDWPAKWDACGGRLYNGRMIALKSDPIWKLISEFDLPYTPFDEDAVMDVNEVGRYEVETFGLKQPDERQPSPPSV